MSANDRESGSTASPTTRCKKTRGHRPTSARRDRAFFDANPMPIHIYQTQDPLVIGNEVLAFFAVDADIDGTQMHLPRIVDHIVLTDDGTAFNGCARSSTTRSSAPR
jgi:hypothetical protein